MPVKMMFDRDFQSQRPRDERDVLSPQYATVFDPAVIEVVLALHEDGRLEEVSARRLRIRESDYNRYVRFACTADIPAGPPTEAQRRAMAPPLLGVEAPFGVNGVGSEVRRWLGLSIDAARALAGVTDRIAMHAP
ncbi:MAG: hypothetical protein ACR2F8_02840 [Caulobacteraceae bacterium]